MVLSRELVILARIVQIICYDIAYDVVDAGGYRDWTYAIEALEKHGLIGVVSGVGRGTYGKWITEGWKTDDGVKGACYDEDVVDNICFMISFLCESADGTIEFRYHDEQDDPIRAALDYLESVSLVHITDRYMDLAPDCAIRSLRKGVVDVTRGRFVDFESIWARRYPASDRARP